MTGDPALDVVIVAHRSRELLRGCLESLRAHPPSVPMKVIVVDNASGDGTAEMVASEFPEVDLVASSTNLGFAAATNLGVGRGDAPYLLALNPDTAVTDGALDTVLEALEEHPEIGVVGPRLLRPDGTLDHAAKRSFPTPLSALGHFTGVGRRRERRREARRLSRAGGRVGPRRRGQRRLHADAAGGVRAHRWIRRGLLDVHGGPGPLLHPGPRGPRHLVRARRHGDAREGRDHRRRAVGPAQLALSPRHVPLLPEALRTAALLARERRGLRRASR